MYALPPCGKGKKWMNHEMQKLESAAGCVHINTRRRKNHQNLSRSRSCNRRWSWIFCSVHTAHAIWAWKGIYWVIWPFEFKSFRIAVRPHIHHVSLEALPSAQKEEIQKSWCLLLYNNENSEQPNMSRLQSPSILYPIILVLLNLGQSQTQGC